MLLTVGALADALSARTSGPLNGVVTHVAALDQAAAGAVVFAQTATAFERAAAAGAGAIIAGPFADGHPAPCPVLIADDPKLAFARAARLLSDPSPPVTGIHPTAVVSGSARVGDDVSIGAHAVVGDLAVIGRGTRLEPGVVLGPGVQVGNDCHLLAHVVVYAGTVIGSRVIVHAGTVLGSDGFGYVRDHVTGTYEKFPQIGGLDIGDDVEIGANTAIDRGALGRTTIGSGTKLDNLVHVAHNVHIGRNVVVAGQTGIAGSSAIGDDAVFAGQVGVSDHVQIEAGVVLAGKTGVPSGKVLRGRGSVYWGIPARPLKEVMRQLAVVARLARQRDRGGSS